MNPADSSDFLYLNSGKEWLGFKRQGLTLRPDGSLSLTAMPGAKSPMTLPSNAKPSGPAGIAAGPHGRLFQTSPCSHRIICTTADGQCPPPGLADCAAGDLCLPRGLLFHPQRGALFVADSGNHCVRIIDPESFITRETWNAGANHPGPPLRLPWQLAQDNNGNVYVLDYRARRIDRFDVRGQWDREFCETLKQQAIVPKRPRLIASAPDGNSSTALFILDARNRQLYSIDTSGRLHMRASVPDPLASSNPLRCDAMAIDENHIYLADRHARRILVFARDFADGQPLTFLGPAVWFDAAVAALAPRTDALLVCTGDDAPPITLGFDACTPNGWLAGGPFHNPAPLQETHWHRLKCQLEIPDGSYARLWIAQVPAGSTLPSGPPFTDSVWLEQPVDAPHCLFKGAAGMDVCVAVEFHGDGHSSPNLSNILLEFALPLYSQYLPPVLLEDPTSRQLLNRLLALLTSEFEDLESEYRNLPFHFDANAVDQKWIYWLAGWLNAELPAGDLQSIRAALAGAYADSQWRGTCDHVRARVSALTGVEIQLEEPILSASPWILPDQCCSCSRQAGVDPPRLGITTVLADAPPVGAVLGNSALLNESKLIDSAAYGTPIYDRLAHRILVRIYRGANYSAQTPAAVKAIVDQQKPAHVAAQYYIATSTMSVGFQSRIGIDAIVASPADSVRSTTTPMHTRGFTYSGGQSSRIGDPVPQIPRLITDA